MIRNAGLVPLVAGPIHCGRSQLDAPVIPLW